MEKRQVSLQDKYILEEGRAFMTGIQALVRLPMVQRRLDQSRGWDTGGFISGYRGSPLGALDQQLVLNRKLLEEHHVRFNPGVNEDLAVSAFGAPETLRNAFSAIIAKHAPDELIVTSWIHDHAARVRSFEITAQVLASLRQ